MSLFSAATVQPSEHFTAAFVPKQECVSRGLPFTAVRLDADAGVLQVAKPYIEGKRDQSVKAALMPNSTGNKSKNTAFKRRDIAVEEIINFLLGPDTVVLRF